MNTRLHSQLVCPIDGGSLRLIEWETKTLQLTDDQVSRITACGLKPAEFTKVTINGLLLNERLKIYYPIIQRVPRLLIFDHPLFKAFRKEFAEAINRDAPDFHAPMRNGKPGEADVLRTFSAEWTDYDWQENAYWGQEAEVYNRCLRFTLNVEKHPANHQKVMELGIGSGGTANYIAADQQCELFGLDLGYSVDVAAKNFDNPLLHVVQASVFDLPFLPNSFDFVYSHGVIHHTYSTRTAFDQLTRFPKPGGGCYIWVYSEKNESRSFKRRFIMLLERLIRPWCWRLPTWAQTIVLAPITPLYMIHQEAIKDADTGRVSYGWREALHAARDRFTPRYIHRHSESEVKEWFIGKGFHEVVALSERAIPDYVPIGFYANTGVWAKRKDN